LVQLVKGEVHPVVGDPVLAEVVGPHLLGPAATADLAAALGGQVGRPAVLLGLQQPRPQDRHGLGPVLYLALLVLHGHHDAGGEMGDADGGVGGVDGLATRAGGTVDVDLQVVRVDGDVD